MADAQSETRILAIASHVAYGYVGNTMVTFVLQSLGCEVSAINTVNYSNHTGYKQWKGRKTTADEIWDLYTGLRQSYLNNYSILISGYIPSAEAVQTVGKIGLDLKSRAAAKPGSFFWVLDPVMGDEGQLYIPPDEVPAYKSLLSHADLILPNQFEAELLSGTPITSPSSIASAISTLHKQYHIPHIIITSIRTSSISESEDGETLSIIGSTATSDWHPRLWRIDVPSFPVYFSGTGDMFAALISYRLREAVHAAGLQDTPRWISPDGVSATDLPSAKAAGKVLASMQAVLGKTYREFEKAVPGIEGVAGEEGMGREKWVHLMRSKAAEVRVVRNVRDLIEPPDLERYAARALDVEF